MSFSINKEDIASFHKNYRHHPNRAPSIVKSMWSTSSISLIVIPRSRACLAVRFRMDGDRKFRTDENNYIIDLHLGEIDDPKALADELIHMVGIVETGRSFPKGGHHRHL